MLILAPIFKDWVAIQKSDSVPKGRLIPTTTGGLCRRFQASLRDECVSDLSTNLKKAGLLSFIPPGWRYEILVALGVSPGLHSAAFLSSGPMGPCARHTPAFQVVAL